MGNDEAVTKGWNSLRGLTWDDLHNSTWDEIELATSTVIDGLPLYETYFNSAMQFDYFIDQQNITSKYEDGIVFSCDVPLVVNTAICCELFLKSICAYKGVRWDKGIKGHSICALLKHADLESGCEKSLGDRFNVPNELKRVDNAFVDWRYEAEHESMMLSLEFFECLRDFLKNEALCLRSKWQSSS